MSDNKENEIPAIPRAKLIDALNPPAWVKVALGIIAILCATVVGLPAAGIALPPLVISVAQVLTALLTGLGVVSTGVAAADKKE